MPVFISCGAVHAPPRTAEVAVLAASGGSGCGKKASEANAAHAEFHIDCVRLLFACAPPASSQLAGVKALETGEFDFSRYGDTLFELLFTGGRISGGSMAVETGDNPLATNVSPSPQLPRALL